MSATCGLIGFGWFVTAVGLAELALALTAFATALAAEFAITAVLAVPAGLAEFALALTPLATGRATELTLALAAFATALAAEFAIAAILAVPAGLAEFALLARTVRRVSKIGRERRA